jgi:hypothetical protein
MACLSFLTEEAGPPFVVCANPIFLVSPFKLSDGEKMEFEILEKDATILKNLVGTSQTFSLDGLPFIGEVTELEPRESTVPGLLYLRHEPAMHGVVTITKRIDLGTSAA